MQTTSENKFVIFFLLLNLLQTLNILDAFHHQRYKMLKVSGLAISSLDFLSFSILGTLFHTVKIVLVFVYPFAFML